MKKGILLSSLLVAGFFSFGVQAQEFLTTAKPPRPIDIQGTKGKLLALYKQRDAIAKGLHDLGYNVCLESRLGRVDKLTEYLKNKNKGNESFSNIKEKQRCPENAKCPRPLEEVNDSGLGEKVLLPLKRGGFLGQVKKTAILERFLEKNGMVTGPTKKKRRPDVTGQFFKAFFHRTSCLESDAIMRGCKLLSSKREIRDKNLHALRKLILADKDFKDRFDGDFACRIADSKSLYVEKLKEVQKEILLTERTYRGELRGQDTMAGSGNSVDSTLRKVKPKRKSLDVIDALNYNNRK